MRLAAALLASCFALPAAADELPPGWAAEFGPSAAQGARTDASSVTTHAEAAAFALQPGESLHPAIDASEFTATFSADIKVQRAGRYRFGLTAQGGKASIDVRPAGATAPSHLGVELNPDRQIETPFFAGWIELKAGVTSVQVQFTRKGDSAARLITWWEMDRANGALGFATEPIPSWLATVPPELAARVQAGLAERRGRVLLTELGCTSCHVAEERLAAAIGASAMGGKRPPILLAEVASRARQDWLRRWLAAPQELKPGCGMPDLFSEREAEDVGAVVQMLQSLIPVPQGVVATPLPDAPVDPALVGRGRTLFHEIGCVACHGPFESPAAVFGDASFGTEMPGAVPSAPFGDLTRKWRVGELARFLENPTEARPHGRMPSFGLDGNDALALAHYLVSRFDGAATGASASDVVPVVHVEPAVAPHVASDAATIERGKEVFNKKGCAACHTLGNGLDEPRATDASPPLAKLGGERGCLARSDAARGKAPKYWLSDAQRADLLAGIASVQRATGSRAPLDEAARTLASFRCTSCHDKSGAGGVAEPFSPYFRTLAEADVGDEGRLPPRLGGVGERLLTPWIEQVIAEGTRARPYVAARMPRFGHDLAGRLATGLAATDGQWRSDAPRTEGATKDEGAGKSGDLALAGRKLAGSGGFNCITCHSFGDRPSAGTPGLDFTQFSQRLQRDWWRRYALAPLRCKPGTRMPTFFDQGLSQVTDILGGDAVQQIDALWDWFEKAKAMPAPEGVPTGERMILDVGDRPLVFRTFLERAGSRGIAVGTPAGLHFAFDAEKIRLVEAWTGEFLDVAPVWSGRGGNIAPEVGSVVWSAPPGPAFSRGAKPASWPDASGRELGWQFNGYRLDGAGTPTFLYQVKDAHDPQAPGISVAERFEPATATNLLFVRTFELTGLKPGETIWCNPGPKWKRRNITNADVETVAVAGGSSWLALRGIDRAQPARVELEILK